MYSKDFDLFLKNQIVVWSSNGGRLLKFNSRLESRNFKTVEYLCILNEDEIKEICYKIHIDLIKKQEC